MQTRIGRAGDDEDIDVLVYRPDPSPPANVQPRAVVTLDFRPSNDAVVAETTHPMAVHYRHNDAQRLQLDADVIDDAQPQTRTRLALDIAF